MTNTNGKLSAAKMTNVVCAQNIFVAEGDAGIFFRAFWSFLF